MMISVVIPHFNQETHLRTCLQRLRAQSGFAAEIEIIVVDNGSRRLPEAVVAEFPGVRLLAETTPGPGPARNTGAAQARGDILAFIDADCHADPGWLAAIEARFRDPSAQIIGGDVRVGYADPARPTFIEPYEAIYSYRNHEHIADGFSGTGNLATRADILRHVGPFAGMGIAEDQDWGLRSGALGYRTVYVPEMIVYHPARDSFRDLTRKWDRHIRHAYEASAASLAGKVKWVVKASAMPFSPLAEIATLTTSNRIAGGKQRLMALACLVLLRGYRGYEMWRVLLTSKARAHGDWQR
jgi:glycosyltransferase involved in cell wall biosynthesis